MTPDSPIGTTAVFASRMERLRTEMVAAGVDATVVSVGHDLPYLTGYEAMPLERATLLVVPKDADAQLLIPVLEAPRVVPQPGVFEIVGWTETEDPTALAARALAGANTVAIGDQMWARFLVEMLPHLDGVRFTRAVDVIGPMRRIKDLDEIERLAAAGAAVDEIATALQHGEIQLVGRTEAEVSIELSERIIAAGHQRVNFAIVAAGENAASPHHHAGPRVIRENEIVLCDFGGTMNGYCSDITRCVTTGEPDAEITAAYEVLRAAHAAAERAATVGSTCESIDAAARSVIDDAGFGEYFIHRTGHGIGMEEHEDPYIVEGNIAPLEAGNAFSVEPGIYVPGRWGMRLEDIFVAADAGPIACNSADHDLIQLA